MLRHIHRHAYTLFAAAAIAFTLTATAAHAIDDAHRDKAKQTIDKTIIYLREQQAADGSWSTESGPAITGMIVAGMTRHGTTPADDPAVRKAIAYLLSKQKANGGIYDTILENYNTSIVLMALGPMRDGDPKIAEAVKRAQDYLRNLQWADDDKDPTGKTIEKDHAWYGGAGYGKHGRPDLSNTATMIAGLRDSGLDCKDPAYLRAMAFISQLQGSEQNTKHGDTIEPGGGFIYAPSQNKEKIETPQTMSDSYTDAEGRTRLRTYGSMTYAGFMSFLYAQLDRDDPRVKDAARWIAQRYTLNENPGVGQQGYYYYLHMMARAMDAWTRGEPRTADADTMFTLADGSKVDWANQLIDKLAELQKPDGSFANDKADRWNEGNPHLATAYALLALQHSVK